MCMSSLEVRLVRVAPFLLAAQLGCGGGGALEPTAPAPAWSAPERVAGGVSVDLADFSRGVELVLTRSGRAAFAVWSVYRPDQGATLAMSTDWTPGRGWAFGADLLGRTFYPPDAAAAVQ